MEKVCLIGLPCGKGDILYCQKIANHYRNLGYRIVWPVIHEYAYLKDYIDNVQWVSWDDKDKKLTHIDPLPDHVKFPYKEFYKPGNGHIFTDDFIFYDGFLNPGSNPVMLNKYIEAKVDHRDWADYVIFKRNKKKEDNLFYNILGLKDGEEFVFVNRNYQMRPNLLFYPRISIDPNNYGGKRVIEMNIVDGYSLFDWSKVIERASEIHMIETSFNYIMEGPQLRETVSKKSLHLYSRHNWFGEVQYLFNLPWNYHT